ncbi:MAG TPA: GNAT family N-acetyltransferase [Sphingobium sp.]|uniref:GNAT family N-acetyltransferase n=1 Tax=Sphingobium sp. TaxID=1912891 RepID=UPI002ECFE198
MIQEPLNRWTSKEGAVAPGSIAPADCAESNSFYEPPLLDAALAQLVGKPVILLDVTGEDGLALARLPVARSSRHGRYPALHCANWVHPHCYYGAPLLRAGREQDGWRGLLEQLDAASWSGDFLHLRLVDADGPAVRALQEVCAAEGRSMLEVARYERALLRSGLSAEAYWTENVRSKKRKELRRQQNRLAECGTISHRVLTDGSELRGWCDAFLAIEGLGWKGEEGTALASSPADERFFRQACADAFAAGGLDMLRIDCNGQAIAMLVNFVGPKGGFSFKIAIDPAFSRYSPGVLVEMDNLARVLDAGRAPWMDSCAAPGHPMIDGLWAERRAIGQYRIALRKSGLAGLRGRIMRAGIGAAEAIRRHFKDKPRQEGDQ